MQRAGSFYLKPYEMSYFYLIDCEDIDFFSGKISKGLARRKEHFRLSVENACGFGRYGTTNQYTVA